MSPFVRFEGLYYRHPKAAFKEIIRAVGIEVMRSILQFVGHGVDPAVARLDRVLELLDRFEQALIGGARTCALSDPSCSINASTFLFLCAQLHTSTAPFSSCSSKPMRNAKSKLTHFSTWASFFASVMSRLARTGSPIRVTLLTLPWWSCAQSWRTQTPRVTGRSRPRSRCLLQRPGIKTRRALRNSCASVGRNEEAARCCQAFGNQRLWETG